MMDLKWCVSELEKGLAAAGWRIEKGQVALSGLICRWSLAKGGVEHGLELYRRIRGEGDWQLYGCRLMGTDIALGFLEAHQREYWMGSLGRFVEMVERNAGQADLGEHAVEDMEPEEAMRLAQAFIDAGKLEAKITGVSWNTAWIDGQNRVNGPVWIVAAENLKPGPFIDGNNWYSIVIGMKSRKVEDIHST